MPPELPISIPRCPYACSAPLELNTSMPPTRPYTRSTPPDLLRQRGNACIAPAELRSSTSPGPQHASRALEAKRQHACSTPPYLHVATPPPHLRRPVALYLHVATPPAHL